MTFYYITYSFKGLILCCKSPILSTVIYPASAFITSGTLFTTVAHVSSTVLGFSTVIVVVGSPSTVQTFLSNSSGAYTFPIHSDSIVIPSLVSVVTIALIPVASPAFTVIFKVDENISSLLSNYITNSEEIEKLTKRADVVCACLGKPNFVKPEWVKKGAILIDAGYNAGNIGDIDAEAYKKASYYTPVPGGVGPVTVAELLNQTLIAFEKQNNIK